MNCHSYLARRLFWISGFVLLSSASLTCTQNSIVGTLTDSAGGVLPSVIVRVTDEKTSESREAITNGQEYYVLLSLPPSTYTIRVLAPGLSSFVRSGVVLATH